MELGNSVDIMRADNAKVSHTHLTVADNAHRGNSVPVARESVPRVLTEALVYLLDDRIYSRETELEEILVPLLKRLGHYGVVGVGAYLHYHIPRSLPRDEVIVDEYSHKLGDAECGVSVVDVDSYLIRKIVYLAVDRHMIVNDALAGCGHEEVLLRKSEQLSFKVVIRRVKHLRDSLGVSAFLHRSCVLSLSKEAHIEVSYISRLPETETAYSLTVSARYHHIVRNSLYLLAVLVDDLHMSLAPFLSYASAHLDVVGSVCSRN